jgi:uncharacterized protein (TIGR03083 family)
METPESRIQLAQATSAQLRQYLHTLPSEAWRRPSACQHWEVRDVVGHLILVAEFYLGVISRGLQGDPSPPAGFPPAGTANAASWAALFDPMSVARRESLEDRLLATFTAASDQLHQLLTRCSPQAWETLCYHAVSLLPVRMFVDLWLTELVMHGWDIRSRFEPEAHLVSESLPAFLELIPGVLQWAFWPGARRSTPARYRFEVTGPIPLKADIVVEGDRARLEPVEAAQANVTFHCAAEPFVLLLYGRLTLPQAIAAGHIAAAGEMDLIPVFAQWFQGV